jgi:hypothetical protein
MTGVLAVVLSACSPLRGVLHQGSLFTPSDNLVLWEAPWCKGNVDR